MVFGRSMSGEPAIPFVPMTVGSVAMGIQDFDSFQLYHLIRSKAFRTVECMISMPTRQRADC